VIKIVKELNYQPDILARMLASKKTYRFAVLMPKPNNDSSFWKAPRAGINKALNEIEHYGLVTDQFLFDQFNRRSFKYQADRLFRSDPDAIIIAPVFYEDALELIMKCDRESIPYVFINSMIENRNNLCFVGQDSKQSGYLSAKLITYGLCENANIKVINISRSLNNHKHIMNRQQGFVSYFDEHKKFHISVHSIEDRGEEVVYHELKSIFKSRNIIDAVYVTNSKVFKIARYFRENNLFHIRLIGYDLIEENIQYLNQGIIDFLISQRPVEQGYYGIMKLYNYMILGKTVKKIHHLPIDIITKENLKYYIES